MVDVFFWLMHDFGSASVPLGVGMHSKGEITPNKEEKGSRRVTYGVWV
jgi:hypothetical protein